MLESRLSTADAVRANEKLQLLMLLKQLQNIEQSSEIVAVPRLVPTVNQLKIFH